ncbi:MAG: hypothetical protein RL701_676 [Pseudomonadota bacterium]
MLLGAIDWAGIHRLRAKLERCNTASLQTAAQDFASLFVDEFESVVLARVFAVLPLALLPATEREYAAKFVANDPRLGPQTSVLSLLGTRGREPGWNNRAASRGHLAIPLIDRSFVHGAPMIAKLLADLEVDLKKLDDGAPIATRHMLGGRNGTFYVPDAQVSKDDHGRNIIASREFVHAQHVRTVFGMGGAYLDGRLIVAIVFTSELLDRVAVDRYPSLISTFKAATAQVQTEGLIFPP